MGATGEGEGLSIAGEAASVIRIGSRVRVRDDNGEAEFCIVHPEEADYAAECISALSPLGGALLGRRLGDLVRFRAPVGVLAVRVVDVR